MNDDLMRQVGSLQTTVDDIKKPEISRNVITPFASLPGLIGLWYGGNYQRSTGDMPNLAPYISGASSQDLSYNGNPIFNYLSNGVGYADLDGTGDYFSVADNTDLDISGTETYINNPGLTVGGWFWLNNVANVHRLLGKYIIEGFLLLYNSAVHGMQFAAINGASSSVATSGGLLANQWYFICSRFIPSTTTDLWINETKYTSGAAAVASLPNTGAAFVLGTDSTLTQLLDGRISAAFLCSSALNDSTIQSLFQQTRSLYGV